MLTDKVFCIFNIVPDAGLVTTNSFKGIDNQSQGVPGVTAKRGYGLIVLGHVVLTIFHGYLFLWMIRGQRFGSVTST